MAFKKSKKCLLILKEMVQFLFRNNQATCGGYSILDYTSLIFPFSAI